MPRPNPDKMSFLEHLEELRVRLVHSAVALSVAFALCWNWHEEIFHFLTEPLRQGFPDIKFIFTGPSEAFVLYMKMAFFVGIFLAAPYILWQVWAFIAPGLYAHEKGYVYPFIFFGTLLLRGRRPLRTLHPLPRDLPLPGRVRRRGHDVHAQGRRVLHVLLLVPAGPRASCSRSRSWSSCSRASGS